MRRSALLCMFSLSILFSLPTRANEADRVTGDTFAGKTEMNGFSLSDFGKFWEQWKQVTVRFREDTKEVRYVYANELALKALRENKTDYPDGAIFGKIGFVSEHDPAFPSSVVPSGSKRYQFMVRDKKKFSATDGWGYVLLNAEGKTLSGDPKANSLACAACHRLVPGRGQVFSKEVQLSPFVEELQKKTSEILAKPGAQVLYATIPRSKLSENLRRFIPERFSNVRNLTGAIQENLFEGTVNEVGPLLAREAAKTKLPAVLQNEEGSLFAFVYGESQKGPCAPGETRLVSVRSLSTRTTAKNAAGEAVIKTLTYCYR